MMRYLELFEKYEEFKKITYDLKKGVTPTRRPYTNINPVQKFKNGEKVVVNGIQDGLYIKNQEGKVVTFNHNGYLVEFVKKFSPRLHVGTGRGKQSWWINPDRSTTAVEIMSLKDYKEKGFIKKEKEVIEEVKDLVPLNIIAFYTDGISIGKFRVKVDKDSSYTVSGLGPQVKLSKTTIKKVLKDKVYDNTQSYEKLRVIIYTDDAEERLVLRKVNPKVNGIKTRFRNSLKRIALKKDNIKVNLDMLENMEKYEEESYKNVKEKIYGARKLNQSYHDEWEQNEDEEDDDYNEGTEMHILELERGAIRKGNMGYYKKSIGYLTLDNPRGNQRWNRNYAYGNPKLQYTIGKYKIGYDQMANGIYNQWSVIIYDDNRKEEAYNYAKANIGAYYRNEKKNLVKYFGLDKKLESDLKNNTEQLVVIEKYNGKDIYNMPVNTKLSIPYRK